MKQKIVGTFTLGRERVQVVLREGRGGEFYTTPGDINYPRIKVGVDEKWGRVLGWLIHEAFELVMDRKGCRLSSTDDVGWDSSEYIFIMSHVQFSDVSVKVGIFLAGCLPKVATAFKNFNKKGVSKLACKDKPGKGKMRGGKGKGMK